MSLIDDINKTREVIEGVLGIITPIAAAIPIIEQILGKLPDPVAQEFPPERIQEIIAAYEAKEVELDKEFLPPSEDEELP